MTDQPHQNAPSRSDGEEVPPLAGPDRERPERRALLFSNALPGSGQVSAQPDQLVLALNVGSWNGVRRAADDAEVTVR